MPFFLLSSCSFVFFFELVGAGGLVCLRGVLGIGGLKASGGLDGLKHVPFFLLSSSFAVL